MGFVRDLTGKTAVEAAGGAADVLQEQAISSAADVGAAGEAAQQFLQPFQDVGQRGVDLAGFLGDPQAQFQFIQNNPLFQAGLENLNQQTQTSAAARGRLSAGDTLQRLTQNATLAAQPLVDRQRSDILNLLNLGRGVASEQAGLERGTSLDVADLLTGGASARAAGITGAATARGQKAGNIFQLATTPLDAIAPQGSIARTGFEFLSGGV